jgi:hypothetical protein
MFGWRTTPAMPLTIREVAPVLICAPKQAKQGEVVEASIVGPKSTLCRQVVYSLRQSKDIQIPSAYITV